MRLGTIRSICGGAIPVFVLVMLALFLAVTSQAQPKTSGIQQNASQASQPAASSKGLGGPADSDMPVGTNRPTGGNAAPVTNPSGDAGLPSTNPSASTSLYACNDHVDNYYDNMTSDANSLPSYRQADLGSGGEQAHISQPITETAPPKLPSYHDDKVTVESRLDEDDSVVLSITSDHGQKDVPLPDVIFQIQEIRRYADRLIVVGDVAAGESQVVIINLNNSTVGDTFLATDPAISPDGRFVAFTEWLPPYGWEDDTIAPDDHALLYDMTKSASANRPAGVTSSDNVYDAGFDVYPGNGNKDDSAPVRLAHNIAGGVFWSPDSTKLVFADQAQSSMKLVLVNVTGLNAGSAPSASILSLDKTGLCPAAPWPHNYCATYLDRVKFLGNGLDAFFKGESVDRELQVKYADFVPSR